MSSRQVLQKFTLLVIILLQYSNLAYATESIDNELPNPDSQISAEDLEGSQAIVEHVKGPPEGYNGENQNYLTYEQDPTLGWIDSGTFESTIVAGNGTQVIDGQTWLIYMFHPDCYSKKCKRLNRAYEQVFADWESFKAIRKNPEMKKVTAQNSKITQARENLQIGRIDCKAEKDSICGRINVGSKPPRYVVLNDNNSYLFRGNLTFEFIEKHIITQQYIEQARKDERQKELDGLTLTNFNKRYIMNIKARYGTDHGSFRENLYYSLAHNFDELKHGIEILATTYGIRKYVEKEVNIFPVAVCILSTPFWIFLLALTWDYIFNIGKGKYRVKTKEEIEKIVAAREKEPGWKDKMD